MKRNPSLKHGQSESLEGEQTDSTMGGKYEREYEQNQITYNNSQQYNDDKHHQTSNRKIIYQNQMYEMAKGSSYICQPINTTRDTVRINDMVVKDNLILSCKPRIHKHRVPYIRSTGEESGNIDGYIHPQMEEELKGEDEGMYPSRHTKTQSQQYQSLGLAGSTLIRSHNFDLGSSLFPQKHLDQVKSGNQKQSGDIFQRVRCTRYTRRFKEFLWIMFFINIFLVIIGLTLFVCTLTHFISRSYMNIVIEQTGFVIWIWIVMILSVFIVIVGIYGIITSIDRGKRKLVVYCIFGLILTLLILAFLIFLWVMFVNMQKVTHSSMRNTFKIYRCNRYIRNAWDDLQEIHKCCGIEHRRDWKYIPPSCCNGTNKQEKLACVGYFIKNNQAFEGGCNTNLDNYFTSLFFIIACLIILACIVLLLGIFVACWLRKIYKKVLNCQEVYYITK